MVYAAEWRERHCPSQRRAGRSNHRLQIRLHGPGQDRGSFACGIRNDDTLSCWGWNNQHIGNRMPTDESPWFNSADLLSLELSDGSLDPAFAGDVTTYSASVANSAASIEVTPEVTNLLSTYAITSNTDTSVEDDEVTSRWAKTPSPSP